MKKTIIAFIGAIMVLCTSCAGQEENHIEEITYNEDTVSISDNSPILSRLKFETVSTEPFSREFRTVGTVGAEAGRYVEVGVPFDGRVQKVNVRIGSRVTAGQALFELSSAEFLETSKQYFQSLETYEKVKANYERKRTLQTSGIISEREMQEVQTEYENALKDKECSEAAITLLGMDPANIIMGQPLAISSPISGEVVKFEITPGSYLKADSDPVITVADLKTVWVTARVKEHSIYSVSEGATTEIYTEAAKGRQLLGKVIYIGNIVDEQTRSVEVIIECDNREKILKHGMFVSIHFMEKPEDSILVPTTAVFQGDGSSYVYVTIDQSGCFIRRKVVTGPENPKKSRILIESGLEKGETILTEGGLFLNN